MIAVVAPGPDQVAGVAQVGDQVLVEALVPQASVEALDDPVLHGFPRRNVAPFNAALFLPPPPEPGAEATSATEWRKPWDGSADGTRPGPPFRRTGLHAARPVESERKITPAARCRLRPA